MYVEKVFVVVFAIYIVFLLASLNLLEGFIFCSLENVLAYHSAPSRVPINGKLFLKQKVIVFSLNS